MSILAILAMGLNPRLGLGLLPAGKQSGKIALQMPAGRLRDDEQYGYLYPGNLSYKGYPESHDTK